MASLKGSITVFPTQVGVIPTLENSMVTEFCIPHASGGDPYGLDEKEADEWYSPRKWG